MIGSVYHRGFVIGGEGWSLISLHDLVASQSVGTHRKCINHFAGVDLFAESGEPAGLIHVHKGIYQHLGMDIDDYIAGF